MGIVLRIFLFWSTFDPSHCQIKPINIVVDLSETIVLLQKNMIVLKLFQTCFANYLWDLFTKFGHKALQLVLDEYDSQN